MGGPITNFSSTAKGKGTDEHRESRPMRAREDNNFQKNTHKVFEQAQQQEEDKEDKPEPVKPKFNFGGLKKQLNRQNEDNSEANKDLAEYQKKLEKEIKIHEAKPQRKEYPQGGDDNEFEQVTDQKKRD